MGRMKMWEDYAVEHDITQAPECAFCGGIPDAFWHGHIVVFVCKECAMHILPMLISDAIIPAAGSRSHYMNRANEARTKFNERFLHAQWSELLLQLDESRPDAQAIITERERHE